MKQALLLTAAMLCSTCAHAQVPAPLLTARFTQLLLRASNGHSPTQEEINALVSDPLAVTSADLKQALPLIQKALESPDAPVRTYALTTLVALQDPPSAPPESGPAPSNAGGEGKLVNPPPTGPSTFKSDFKVILAPAVPAVASHLTEEVPSNRILAAGVLGGFSPDPAPAIYPALFAFLKRDDAIGSVGLAVVQDLLALAPLSPATASSISAYLRRSDQTADSRANLVDAISSSPHQSQLLNQTLLSFLDAEDSSLRARVILSLPGLDLAADVFADTRSRISALAANDQENLQVVNAAKAITPCWTTPHMTGGCPVYQ